MGISFLGRLVDLSIAFMDFGSPRTVGLDSRDELACSLEEGAMFGELMR